MIGEKSMRATAQAYIERSDSTPSLLGAATIFLENEQGDILVALLIAQGASVFGSERTRSSIKTLLTSSPEDQPTGSLVEPITLELSDAQAGEAISVLNTLKEEAAKGKTFQATPTEKGIIFSGVTDVRPSERVRRSIFGPRLEFEVTDQGTVRIHLNDEYFLRT